MEDIVLRKMSDTEFEMYFKNKIERYTDVLSQNKHEQGEEPAIKAYKQLKNLLPKGLATPNHHLLNILKGELVIGYVWLKVEEDKRSAFLYEIFIYEEYRGKGLGTKTMRSIEELIQQKGVSFFKLHVFGSNTGARKLYEELGFEIAGVNMLKLIE